MNKLMLRLGAVAGVIESASGSWIKRYATALAAVAVATLMRSLLDPLLGTRAPYGIYLIATVLVVWRAGLGPAVTTVLTGAVLARYFFEEPRGTIAIVSESNLTSIVMSLTLGMVMVFLCESLRVTAINNALMCQEARRADARKDEFLATLAHELRNPLAPIRNAIYLLNSAELRDPRTAELHQLIANQTEHLVHLVDDLLDVARITRGKIELARAKVKLNSVVAAAHVAVRPLLSEKSLTFDTTLPAEQVTVFADEVRLTQILTNLLNNAAKYTDRGGRVWLSAHVERGDLVIRIRDTGIGIAPEMRDRIFNPFEQADPAIERSHGGLGIGLTLVRSLVEMHGGTVEAKSPGLGLGSEFTVRLPVIAAVEAQPAPAPQNRLLPEATDLSQLHVLVLDDSHASASSLASVLRLWKVTVAVSHDGFSALETARTFMPHVILADLGMPRMHGYQFAEELRRLPGMNETILIAITGYGQPADLTRSHEVGFAHHLVKPIDPDRLKQLLHTILAQENR